MSLDNKDGPITVIRGGGAIYHVDDVHNRNYLPDDVVPAPRAHPTGAPTKPDILVNEQASNDTKQLRKKKPPRHTTIATARNARENDSPGGYSPRAGGGGGRMRRTAFRRRGSTQEESEEDHPDGSFGEIRPRLNRGLRDRSSRGKRTTACAETRIRRFASSASQAQRHL